MASLSHPITPCLWFDRQAEDAASFYTSVFEGSRIREISRYTEETAAASGQPAGSVLTVSFELAGQPFLALNGGPSIQLNEGVSFTVYCDTQQEVDYYWDRLREGGDESAQQCGWLKDRFGLCWQIVPSILPQLLTGPDPEKARRALAAMLQMKKLDIATLEQA
ncbi:VOC family protein [Arhodomonas sp. AD133]|uniref:VOC family protein n=1 Tax=Arhodomonas sp. AD133 TaxID=3415009 RepID=UPI003EB71BAA